MPTKAFGKRMDSEIIIYALVASIFVLMEVAGGMASVERLRLLLMPVSWLVSLSSGGGGGEFIAGMGYFHPQWNILINKSCSGFNFWAISFLVGGHALASAKGFSLGTKLFLLPALLVASYCLAIVANTSRILFALTLRPFELRVADVPRPWLHQAEGVFVYLFFLVVFYFFLHYFNQKSLVKSR